MVGGRVLLESQLKSIRKKHSCLLNLITMDISTDPYELKLLQMFQSCDTEDCGLLDESALRRLCGLLELRDKGTVLIESLSADGCKLRVSFESFKEALLNFLGTELDGRNASTASNVSSLSNNESFNCIQERALIISGKPENCMESTPDLSEREVSPKLIVGSKKYGRRSKPQTYCADDLSSTDSDSDAATETNHRNCFTNNTKTVQRSSSQADITSSRQQRLPTVGNKLKRCASLPAQQYHNKPVAIGKIKPLTTNKSAQKSTQKTLRQQQKLSNSVESLDVRTQLEVLSAQSIVDIWERANIANSKGMLLALGFEGDEVNVTQLNKVLEEELRSMDDEMPFARAALALQSAESTALVQKFRQLQDENVKLRADNKNANSRVAILAAEIDERHAILEETSKKEIRLLEQRHTALVRDLTTRMTNDREHWSNLITRLEERIKTYEQEEIKLKTDLELVRIENDELESEQQKLQKQITELLEKNIQLNGEIADLVDAVRGETHIRGDSGEKSNADDEMLHMMEKLSSLQLDNTKLRDKNDELVADIENLNLELTKLKARPKKAATAGLTSADVSEEIVLEEETDYGIGATATKRRGDSPSKTKEESPRLGKQRKCGNETALNSELEQNTSHISSSDDSGMGADKILTYQEKIADLETQLTVLRNGADSSAAAERCKELEASLEQMQRAYEDCEDYWQSKLSEERQLFEKERQMYEEEQLENDKKFTDLMEKVREYEEQFSKDGRLSPIEEKCALEQQYADLEAEAEEIRENSRRLLEEKTKEIESLQYELADLRMRLGESVEIITGANELKSEASEATQVAASSPISYLWQQSTIQDPVTSSSSRSSNRINLSTSETTIFSTKPVETVSSVSSSQTVSPIQKPSTTHKQPQSEGDIADCETSSTVSGKSYDTHSLTSTQSCSQQNKRNQDANCTSPSSIKEELKRLKYFEITLRDQIKDLTLQRDGLVMELQQLQEARPVLEKAYRTPHPNLMQRANQLELKNRHLQNAVKLQQQYTESIMQQAWNQHQLEISDLHNRIEAQGNVIAKQTQGLQNADILVKDLYVENSHLTATVQRLEQRAHHTNLMQLNRLPGMP